MNAIATETLLSKLKHQGLSSTNLIDTLQDIALKVQIDSMLVGHLDCKSSALPIETIARFQQLPQEIQEKYINLQLRAFLYGFYYNGSLKEKLALNTNLDTLEFQSHLENSTISGIDVKFYQQLEENNCGDGYFDFGWSVLKRESNGNLRVKKNGLTLYIQPEKHLKRKDRFAAIGDLVAIWTPNNRLQAGFYMAIGNAGPYDIFQPLQLVRIYFNLTPEGSISAMNYLTKRLNEAQLPFTFKVLYNPADYRRYDSGVLYFEKNTYELVRQIIQNLYRENNSQFKAEIPLFTKMLAPGVGLAEEPDFYFNSQESFGMNRCQIVANGLLKARNESPEVRLASILQEFSLFGIKVTHPYLNATSEDVYDILDC